MDYYNPNNSKVQFLAIDVTIPYEFIGFGAMDATKPYEFYRVWGHGCYQTR